MRTGIQEIILDINAVEVPEEKHKATAESQKAEEKRGQRGKRGHYQIVFENFSQSVHLSSHSFSS